MRSIDPGYDWDSWREQARGLLRSKVHPSQVRWTREKTLFTGFEQGDAPDLRGIEAQTKNSGKSVEADVASTPQIRVPKAFFELAEAAILHRELARWDLLYRMLWRIVLNGESHLMEIQCDDDVLAATKMAKAVNREIHKMHAFVRFRNAGQSDEGREYYVAWFEPEHWVVKAGCKLFQQRLANMDWSIYSPRGCAHWIDQQLSMTEPVSQDPTATLDGMEELWKTYYKSIFNPARVKLKAMQSEMPKKYWKNLPEAELIGELTEESQARVQGMFETEARPAKSLPGNKYLQSLYEMTRRENESNQ